MSGGPTTDHLTTPPATPPAKPLRLPSVAANGTPHNRGSASRSHRDDANDTKGPPPRVAKDYEEYLLEDLAKHRVYISFENGLQNILHVPSDWKSSGHEYQRIISEVRGDGNYNGFRDAYFEICDKVGAIEPTLYKPQVALYNCAISLINKFCDERYRKDENLLLHFRVNHPKNIAQGIFHPPGLNPDITGIFKPLENIKSFVWPMIVHVEEMKDSDAALDTGNDAPRAIIKGEEDPVSQHHYPSRKPAKAADASAPSTIKKRKNTSDASTANKASRTTQQSSPSTRQDSESITTHTDNQKTIGARLQCARYLMEMLELSILRSHAFLTLADRDHLQLMYADRSAIVTTSIIDLRTSDGEALFLAMIIAFHRLTPKQWGFLPLVDNSFTNEASGDTAYHHHSGSITQKRDCLMNLKLCLEEKKVDERNLSLTLQDIIYHQPGIIGRGTCVVEANCQDFEEWREQELVVKVSWPSKSRQSEISLLERARKKGEELLEKRKAQRAALEMEIEGLRKGGNFGEAAAKSEEAQALVEESGKHWALNHLPNILHSEDFSFGSDKEPMPQVKLLEFFNKAEIVNGVFAYEPRVLRVSVQDKLFKISTLPSLPKYAQTFYDILICHRWLYDFVRILHRDISSGNIMYRIIDEKVYGVLNDLDLSSLLEDVQTGTPTSFQRTGTPPYMAIDLLVDNSSPPRHLYRHDLESLVYVILLLCAQRKFTSGGQLERLPQSQFDGWFDANASWSDLAGRKLLFLTRPGSVADVVHESFQDFVPWLDTLLNAFKRGLTARLTWNSEIAEYNKHMKATHKDTTKRSFNLKKAFGVGDMNVDANIPKPLPFDEATLGGTLDFRSLALSLVSFRGEDLEYHSKD